MMERVICAMKKYYIAFMVCLVLLLVGCGQNTKEPNYSSGANASSSTELNTASADIAIDYGKSTQFSQQDMDLAIETIKNEFATWDGCVLHSLTFYGDEAGNEYLEEYNTWGNPTYKECIAFNSTFHSPVKCKTGTAWEEDSEYEWQWYLMRDNNSDPWTLITWGEG